MISPASTPLLVFAGGPGEGLGAAVAHAGDVDGDGHGDVIAAAPNASPAGPASGLVRVYSGADGSILRTFTGAAAGDELGRSAAAAGDVNGDGFADVILGAPFSDAGGPDSGTAYVRSGLDGSVLHVIAGTEANGQLGYSVAGCGDLNGDGRADFIVGERWASPNGTKSGRARVYSGQNGAVLFTFDGAASDDALGTSVSGAGDVNGDGVPDVVVGAPFADSNGVDAGRVRVHSGSNGAVLFTFDGGSANAWLGLSVAGAGDVNGDGRADVIAGAPNDGGVGRATAWSGSSGSIIFTTTGAAAGDSMGISVAGGGDVNGDGFADVLIGGSGADGVGADSGTARLFLGPAGGYLGAINGAAPGDLLGSAVAVAGDLGGDGFADLIVGIPSADVDGADAGQVRVYRLPLASGSVIGAGCAATSPIPVLTSASPVLGTSTNIMLTNASPNHAGALVASFGVAVPSPLGGGCTAYVDLASFFEVATISTSAAGSWTFSMPVPSSPSSAGVDLVLQAVIFATTGPLGADVTNGLNAQIGY